MGWLIVGAILLGIVLIIAAVCLVPIYIRLYSDPTGQPQFQVRVLWLRIPNGKKPKAKAPAKPKKQPSQKASSKKGDSALLKRVGIADYTSAENLKESIKEKGLFTTIGNLYRLIKPILMRIVRLVKKIRICRLQMLILCTGENAAMDYGRACAVVYPLAGYVQSLGPVNKNAVDVQIGCDYQQAESEFSYDIMCSIRVGSILLSGLGILKSLFERRNPQ